MVVNDRLDEALEQLTAIVGGSSSDDARAPLADARRGARTRPSQGRRARRRSYASSCDYTGGPTRKGNAPVISPRIDRLLEKVDSNYASVVVAAKRARQINSYYHNLGEGTFDEFPPPMIETSSKNYLTIALEEVAAGKIKYHYR